MHRKSLYDSTSGTAELPRSPIQHFNNSKSYLDVVPIALYSTLGTRSGGAAMSDKTLRAARIVSVVAATVISLSCGTNVCHILLR